MRTAAEFDQFYATPDPWRISRATFRDQVLRRSVGPSVIGKSVLELGCGEGHLTGSIFSRAKSVKGVDFSAAAIDRARAKNISNASFETADFLDISFAGYDVIAAIECVYYLESREAFFAKVAREHCGVLVLSCPITGSRYFTHEALMAIFAHHGLSVTSFSNLNIRLRGARWYPKFLLEVTPDWLINQRCYVLGVPPR